MSQKITNEPAYYFLCCTANLDAYLFDVFTQGKSSESDVLSCYGVGHCQLTVAVILDEGIKAACVHLGLQYDLAPCDVLGIYFYDPDMLTVDRCVEKIQSVTVKDEISS